MNSTVRTLEHGTCQEKLLLEQWNDAVVYPLAYIVAFYCVVVLLYETVC